MMRAIFAEKRWRVIIICSRQPCFVHPSGRVIKNGLHHLDEIDPLNSSQRPEGDELFAAERGGAA